MDNSRQGILRRFRAQIARGEPIIAVAPVRALRRERRGGGIDLLIVYNSDAIGWPAGKLRGLLAYGNANQIVKEMAYEVLPL